MTICRKAVPANDCDGLASPINLDQRYILFVEPSEDLECDAAAAVQNDDPRGQIGISLEVSVLLLLLRKVGVAVPDEERSRIDFQRHTVAAQNDCVRPLTFCRSLVFAPGLH
jgi:hypothetical protein